MYDKLFSENAKEVFLTSDWHERLVIAELYRELLYPTFSGKIVHLYPFSTVTNSAVECVLQKLGWEKDSFKVSQSITGSQVTIEFK